MSEKVLKITPVITLAYGISLILAYTNVFLVSGDDPIFTAGSLITTIITITVIISVTAVLVTLDRKNAMNDSGNATIKVIYYVINIPFIIYGLLYFAMFLLILIVGFFTYLSALFDLIFRGSGVAEFISIVHISDILFLLVLFIYCAIYLMYSILSMFKKYL